MEEAILMEHFMCMINLYPFQLKTKCTVLLTKRGKNEFIFSPNSLTKQDVEKPITFLESACICVSSCEFMLCHVMSFRFRSTTSNIGLKQQFFTTLECNGVKASKLQHNCTIIVCMSMSILTIASPLVMEISSRL